MKRGTKIVLVAGLSLGLVVASSFVFIKTNRIFAKENSYVNTDLSLILVNNVRVSKGLNKLNWNDELAKAAQAKANDMFAKNYFDHTAPDGAKAWDFILNSGYSYRFAGENLAVEFDNVNDAFTAWEKSPTHLENILSSKFNDYALVEKEGNLNGKNVKVYVQLFGTK